MTKFICFLACLLLALEVSAQGHVFSTSLTSIPQRDFLFRYEFRWNARKSLMFQSNANLYNGTPDGIFDGQFSEGYAQRQIEKYSLTTGKLLEKQDWFYLDGQRPFSEVNSAEPVQTIDFQLGYRFSFQRDSARWRFFLQPGFGVSKHRFFKIRDEKTLIQDEVTEWIEGAYPNQVRVWQHTIAYQQTRTMRRHEAWVYGPRYDIGLSWFDSGGFVLEARVAGGLNVETPHELNLPKRLRPSFVAFSLDAGFWF